VNGRTISTGRTLEVDYRCGARERIPNGESRWSITRHASIAGAPNGPLPLGGFDPVPTSFAKQSAPPRGEPLCRVEICCSVTGRIPARSIRKRIWTPTGPVRRIPGSKLRGYPMNDPLRQRARSIWLNSRTVNQPRPMSAFANGGGMAMAPIPCPAQTGV